MYRWHDLNNTSLRETSWTSLDQRLQMLMENSSKVYGPMTYRCAHIKGSRAQEAPQASFTEMAFYKQYINRVFPSMAPWATGVRTLKGNRAPKATQALSIEMTFYKHYKDMFFSSMAPRATGIKGSRTQYIKRKLNPVSNTGFININGNFFNNTQVFLFYGPMSYRYVHIKGEQGPISSTGPINRNGISNTQLFTQFLNLLAKNHLS